jgi:hypothetical protein
MTKTTEKGNSMTPAQAASVRDTGMGLMGAARWFTETIIDGVTPAQWMHQVSPGANHVMFNVGHIALVDRQFLAAAGGQSTGVPDSYEALFAPGCEPSDRADDYPSPSELLEVLRAARAELIEHFQGLSGSELLAPGDDERLADVASPIALIPGFASFHEGTHSGQILLIRRSLGLARVLGM